MRRNCSRPIERATGGSSRRAPRARPTFAARIRRSAASSTDCSGGTTATVLRMNGWETWQRQTVDGAVESEQRVAVREPVVDFSAAGAERLGRAYWREVERFTL